MVAAGALLGYLAGSNKPNPLERDARAAQSVTDAVLDKPAKSNSGALGTCCADVNKLVLGMHRLLML